MTAWRFSGDKLSSFARSSLWPFVLSPTIRPFKLGSPVMLSRTALADSNCLSGACVAKSFMNAVKAFLSATKLVTPSTPEGGVFFSVGVAVEVLALVGGVTVFALASATPKSITTKPTQNLVNILTPIETVPWLI
jgi:hypothetical protein